MPIPTAASAGATHGAVVPIASVLITSTTPTVLFSNIPQNYQDLMLRMSMRSDNTAFNTPVSYSIYVNGASGTAGFSGTDIGFTSVQQFSSRRTTSTPCYGFQSVGSVPTLGSSIPNSIGYQTAHILSYSNTTTYKTALLENGGDAGGTVTQGSGITIGTWAYTFAINSLLIGPYGNLLPGSMVSLYGVRGVGQ